MSKDNIETIKNKILKLQSLVERGETGEAANAKRLLDKLLSRYGLTLEDILLDQEEKKWYEFKASKNWEKELLYNCYYKILNRDQISFRSYKGTIAIELTACQFAELSNYYDWNKRQLGKELKQMVLDFTDAYIIRHNITNEGKDDDEEKEQKTLTSEDINRMIKLSHLIDTVEDSTYLKQLK